MSTTEVLEHKVFPIDRKAVLSHVKDKVQRALESLDAREGEYEVLCKTVAEKTVRDEIVDFAGRRGGDTYGALLEYVSDDLFGLGLIEPLLRDEAVTDILVEGVEIFVVSGNTRRKIHEGFGSEKDVRRVIDRITARVGKRVDVMNPACDCELYEGSRCHIIIPPAADRCYITVRKLGCMDLELSDWVAGKVITAPGAELLTEAVRCKKNIIVAGGTGAGKTTLLNSLSKQIESDQIIITLEDTYELRIDKPHVRRLLTRSSQIESQGDISFSLLIKNAMRMNPDRLIMGEVRDEAAYDLLHALNTGHRGSISTIHANSVIDALWRLETLASMAKLNSSLLAIRRQISRVVDLVVFIRGIELDRGRYRARRIVEVCRLIPGLSSGEEYQIDVLYSQEGE